MAHNSLDEVNLVIAIYRGVQTLHGDWLTTSDVNKTAAKLKKCVRNQGLRFLTETLPSIGKALDRALVTHEPMELDNQIARYRESDTVSGFPKLFGELFRRVFDKEGRVLIEPCVVSIQHLRTLLFIFYKYEVPYNDAQQNRVLQSFLESEREIAPYDEKFTAIEEEIQSVTNARGNPQVSSEYCVDNSDSAAELNGRKTIVLPDGSEKFSMTQTVMLGSMMYNRIISLHQYDLSVPAEQACSCQNESSDNNYAFASTLVRACLKYGLSLEHAYVVRRARALLHQVLSGLDLRKIVPRHGPGVTSTGDTAWDKWQFKHVPDRLTAVYPYDQYFKCCVEHWAETLSDEVNTGEIPAKVLLVPKDSRGPRLISCEPTALQWIQQGQRAALYHRIESHPISRWNVFFTNQQPNQFGALLGSKTGQYATLDLKEASDRVTVGIVKLLFPADIVRCLLASRSLSTKMPDGQEVTLHKFAPMGSAVCFPILALTVWSLLTSATTDTDVRENILVYGDDVIVPTAYAATAIKTLEAFGLKVNNHKSCITGFFRESCGMDAYKGVCVTPLRVKSVIPRHRSPQALVSWCKYAEALAKRRYWDAYWLVAEHLQQVYGQLPQRDFSDGVSLPVVTHSKTARKWNKDYQRWQYKVPSLVPTIITKRLGWPTLHRALEGVGGASVLPDVSSDVVSEHCTTEVARLRALALSVPSPSLTAEQYTLTTDLIREGKPLIPAFRIQWSWR